MKTLLPLLLFLAALTCAHAQSLPADSTTGKIVYRGAVLLPAGVTQAQAFGRAKIWLADAFAGKALLADDAATGLLSGGGLIPVKGFSYAFRVRLQVEPGQVRYRLDEFTWNTNDHSANNHGTAEEQRDSKLGMGKGTRTKMLAELNQKVRAGLGQLSQELAGSSTGL